MYIFETFLWAFLGLVVSWPSWSAASLEFRRSEWDALQRWWTTTATFWRPRLMGLSMARGVPVKFGSFTMDTPSKIDDFWVPLWLRTPRTIVECCEFLVRRSCASLELQCGSKARDTRMTTGIAEPKLTDLRTLQGLSKRISGDLSLLVGGLVAIFYFPTNIGLHSSSQLTNSYFSEGWLNHQPAWYSLMILI